MLIFSSKNRPSLAARIQNAKLMVADPNHKRSGALVGPRDGVFHTSFDNGNAGVKDYVQVVLDTMKGRETIEHCVVPKNPIDNGRKVIHEQLDCPHPLLYYYQ